MFSINVTTDSTFNVTEITGMCPKLLLSVQWIVQFTARNIFNVFSYRKIHQCTKLTLRTLYVLRNNLFLSSEHRTFIFKLQRRNFYIKLSLDFVNEFILKLS